MVVIHMPSRLPVSPFPLSCLPVEHIVHFSDDFIRDFALLADCHSPQDIRLPVELMGQSTDDMGNN
jgi:hypothetical protein